MNKRSGKQAYRLGLVIAAAICGLTACGGGGEAASATTVVPNSAGGATTSSTANAVAATMTLPQYAVARSTPGWLAGLEPGLSKPLAATSALALEDMKQMLGASGPAIELSNAAAAPLLSIAHLNALMAAARGQTLDDLNAKFPDLAQWNGWWRGSSAFKRAAWGQRGLSFSTDFLTATDRLGASTPAWSEGETGYADGSAYSDSALKAALTMVYPTTFTDAFRDQTHLALIDSLEAKLVWPAAQQFDGWFQTEDVSGYRRKVPMLRITQGVRRYTDADFVANALAVGDFTLLSIQPRSGGLRPFLFNGGLEQALKRTAEVFLTAVPAGALETGELVMPTGDLAFASSNIESLLVRRSATQAYDEVNANLKGLDGVGGSYVKAHSGAFKLKLGSTGAALKRAVATEFVFSIKNLAGQVSGVIFTMYPGSFSFPVSPIPTCPTAQADMRSNFLVLLDTNQAVIALLSVGTLEGEACIP